MNEHEEQFITAFIAKEKRNRYRFLLESNTPQRRKECLDRLNHCRDLNEQHVVWLPRDPRSLTRDDEIAELLRKKGCPQLVYVIGGTDSIDGQTLPLLEALNAAAESGWGTILSCVPGKLAYYHDERGERRAILERKSNRF